LSKARLAILALSFWAGQAHSALPDEIQVYIDDIRAPHESGVELHINVTPSGRSAPDYPGEVTPYHGLRVTPEISYGFAPDSDAGLYLPFARDADGFVYFAGPKFRLKWLPLRQAEGTPGAFAGVNAEVALVQRKFVEARYTLEIRPILGWRSASWLIAFNPTLGDDLAGEERGVFAFHPAAKIARDVGEKTALGIEYCADFGPLDDPLPRGEQLHTLFLVLDAERKLGWNIGIGRGLTQATDRWTLKAIISY